MREIEVIHTPVSQFGIPAYQIAERSVKLKIQRLRLQGPYCSFPSFLIGFATREYRNGRLLYPDSFWSAVPVPNHVSTVGRLARSVSLIPNRRAARWLNNRGWFLLLASLPS